MNSRAAISGRCPVEDGFLAYDSRGEGPPLVLLHGFSFDRRAWDGQVDRLAQAHRVVRYDLRGFGASSLPTGRYSHSRDLGGLLDELHLERPLVVGLSLGANVAMDYALTHPENLTGQVLVSPGLVGHSWTDLRPSDAAAAHATLHGVSGARQFWLEHELFASLRRHPIARERLRTMVQAYSGWHWVHPNPVDMENAADRLAQCRVPTCVMSGDLDLPGYRLIATRIAREVPGAELVRFPSAGHVLNDEADPEFTAAVLGFAARLAHLGSGDASRYGTLTPRSKG